MASEGKSLTHQFIKSSHAAAIAGILFTILFGASMVVMRLSFLSENVSSIAWLEGGLKSLGSAADLMPWSGRTFLWSKGEVRDHLGSEYSSNRTVPIATNGEMSGVSVMEVGWR